MRFNGQEIDDIRDALYSRVEVLKLHHQTLEDIAAELAAGEKVFPFAPGDAGVRAAKGMAADMTVRIGRLEDLISRVNHGEDEAA